MTKLLHIRELRAYYGRTTALHGISFDVQEGNVTALLGANGAGKTTTLRAISGMVKRSGEIMLKERSLINVQTEDIARLGVAHVPSGRGTFEKQTVENNLKLGAISRRDKTGIVADIEMVYSYFPILKQRRDQQAGLLSGGQQQMLAVGRALMLRPKLLLLDEPSFGIAPLVVREIFEIFRRLNRELRTSILLVEQNASIALQLADHAYLIETGRIVFSGTSADIRNNEQLRRSYLGH
ncbi:ABC transporter ATP-binding protein [Bradyrhizobium australafricanum]|uniref:ABC transporter ATP-binding protein n=1 Tax=Bradyrhizobium australafricanum TaxID=2821406 RepID=UPI001CE3B04E|nr:ABC transporter ATP-binding protein [Bradyrhizobium australafricanum]MCA6100518.1 ABC transporter ATP-binding protein [Bradyrhizobium australafricanum]